MEQKSKFKTFQILHLALCAGLLLFLFLVCMIRSNNGSFFSDTAPDSIVLMVVILIAIISFLLSNFLYKSLLKKIDTTLNADERFQKYMSANIVRFAFIEGAALFSVVEFLLTGSEYFLLIAILMIIINILYRPTKEKISKELQLNYSEQEKLGLL